MMMNLNPFFIYETVERAGGVWPGEKYSRVMSDILHDTLSISSCASTALLFIHYLI